MATVRLSDKYHFVRNNLHNFPAHYIQGQVDTPVHHRLQSGGTSPQPDSHHFMSCLPKRYRSHSRRSHKRNRETKVGVDWLHCEPDCDRSSVLFDFRAHF